MREDGECEGGLHKKKTKGGELQNYHVDVKEME